MYGFQSYISVPIRLANGDFFGTLCAIDPRPARVNNAATIGVFTLFAQLIAVHLDQSDRLAKSEADLAVQRQRSALQDQFVAVLGHDLRNPLSAIQTSAALLRAEPLTDKAASFARVIDRSARRMTDLVENLLDFTRARLGEGLSVTRRLDSDLESMVMHVVSELQTVWPDRLIHTDIALPEPVLCDRSRLGQLLSNLVSNAITHGAPDSPVWIRARSDLGGFELSVANRGEPIPAEDFARLFQPVRADVRRVPTGWLGSRPLYRGGNRQGA